MIPRMMPPIAVFCYVMALGAFAQSEPGTVGDLFGVILATAALYLHVTFGKRP